MNPVIPQTTIRELQIEAPWRERLFPNNEWALLLVILIEGAIFSVTGNNFLTAANAFEITRLSVEVGLLALALTPIIITAGIDLSVGSMMGLAAVVLGNAIYFLIMPHLPPAAQHRSLRLLPDLGLLIDFWICLVLYGLIALLFPPQRRRPPSEQRR